jgi:superfamily I DNA/RNA helicase
LTLPICYRCPKKVVELAQTIVSDIMPYDKAPEGEIIDIDIENLQKYAKPGSYVLSRTNAPLIKYCMRFLKNNIPANILGRDIGNGLLYLIKKSKKKKVTDLLKWIVEWEKQEKEKLLIKYPKANTDFISDKAECINMLCEDASSLDEVKENIANLFKDNDEKSIVLFSSVHKIKGKETDIVFILADTLRSSNEEELNIKYVSFTRAKSKLYLVRKCLKP